MPSLYLRLRYFSLRFQSTRLARTTGLILSDPLLDVGEIPDRVEGHGRAADGIQGLALLDVETKVQLYVPEEFTLECSFPTFEVLLDSRFPGHISDFGGRF
jgi:hypothetical protein